ncbi:MAG: helix-turn-helix domain-containing protein [bacterium]
MTKEEIIKLRKSLGLTQEQFARRLKLAYNTISSWERGLFSPSPLALEKLKRLQKRNEKTN